jgi:hypothetical protein
LSRAFSIIQDRGEKVFCSHGSVTEPPGLPFG